MRKIGWMRVYLQYKRGAYWRVKNQSHISISKAPGALFRKNTVCFLVQGRKNVNIIWTRIKHFGTDVWNNSPFHTQNHNLLLREENKLPGWLTSFVVEGIECVVRWTCALGYDRPDGRWPSPIKRQHFLLIHPYYRIFLVITIRTWIERIWKVHCDSMKRLNSQIAQGQ